MTAWQERLAALEDELTRQMPGEAGARFAAAVADWLKSQARLSPEAPDEAFRAALDHLIDVLQERTFNDAFCARTRALREAAGLSRAEIADAIGITEDEYAECETATALPAYLIEPFAEAAGCRITDLFEAAQ